MQSLKEFNKEHNLKFTASQINQTVLASVDTEEPICLAQMTTYTRETSNVKHVLYGDLPKIYKLYQELVLKQQDNEVGLVDQSCYVYLITCMNQTYCKIGISISPENRLRDLNLHAKRSLQWTPHKKIKLSSQVEAKILENSIHEVLRTLGYEPDAPKEISDDGYTEIFKYSPWMLNLLTPHKESQV